MTQFRPKVSIVIPVYNGANYLQKAIDSAINQTYENLEIIVVNDGSKDDGATDKIARSYGGTIRYFTKENGGVASALNFGIEKMTGQYFSWLSHDDMYYPNKVEKQVLALADIGDPNVIAVCNLTVIDEEDRIIKSRKIANLATRSIRCFLATDVDGGLNGCSLLIPRELFLKHGFFDEDLKTVQDYDLWFRFSYHTRFHIMEEELVMSRWHEAQGGRTMGKLPTIEADKLRAMILSKITMEELHKFLGDDINYLIDIYPIFQEAGYKKTAAKIYAHAVQLAIGNGNMEKAVSLFSSYLFSEDMEKSGYGEQTLQTLTSEFSENKKPTLIVFCNAWVRGGIERVMAVLLHELKHKYNFILVSFKPKDGEEGFALPGEVCHVEIRKDLLPEIPYVLLMLASLSKASLAIINPNILVDVLKIYPVMKDSEIKTIACNHYYYFLPFWSPWLYPLMEQRLSHLKDATVATWLNSFNASAYALHNNNGAVMHNPNTFHQMDIRPTLASENIILCVGRFYDAIKRLDRALIVFKHVLALKPDAKLVLVGGYNLDMKIPVTSSETIRELLFRLNFPEGSVVFTGDQDSVEEYYQKASVLIMPSDSEGFSLVINEAGAHSIPSVIFKIPGLDDIVTDGLNGFVVEQDDAEGMAEKVVDLLSNEELRQSMGQNAREMTRRFDRDVICTRWSRLIDLVLSIDNSRELEKNLAESFMLIPKNTGAFLKIISREYQTGVQTVLSRANESREKLADCFSVLEEKHQRLKYEHENLLNTNHYLSESHQALMAHYQNLIRSRPVRYASMIKEIVRKFKS